MGLWDKVKRFFDMTPRCHCGEPIGPRFPEMLECRVHAELRINRMIWEWRTSPSCSSVEYLINSYYWH